MLWMHRQAFTAERAGQYDRADFYWVELNRVLPAVWGNETAWTALVNDSGAAGLDSQSVRSAVASEIIRDTHYAFSAAHAANPDGRTRAIEHLRRMLNSLKYCADTDRSSRYGDVAADAIREEVSAARLDVAAGLSGELLEQFPHDPGYQALNIDIAFKRATADVGDEGTKKARRLQRTIDQLNAWRTAYDDHADLYEALGVLYLTHAVAAANGGDVSGALVDVVKAEAAHPRLDGIEPLKQQLTKVMQDMQHRMKELEATLARTPNSRLSADGYRLRAQTRLGFGPAIEWVKSADAESMKSGRVRGVSRTTWRHVGLPHDQWTEANGFALVAALNAVLRAEPKEIRVVEAAWRDAASGQGLSNLNSSLPVIWVARRLALSAAPPRASAPVVTLTSVGKQPGHEPLVDWLVSGGGRRVRWQLAAAAVLAFATIGGFARDAYRDHVRERAWQTLQTASSPLAAVLASEDYFSVGRPRLEPADRERTAWDIYAASIVRVLGTPGAAEPGAIAQHVTKFADLAARKPKPASAEE
jgi:hypothetical protein